MCVRSSCVETNDGVLTFIVVPTALVAELLHCSTVSMPIATALCSAERGDATASPLAVRLSVTFRYRNHIDWNTSKIISRPNSLRYMLRLTPTWTIGPTRTPQKLGWNRGAVTSTKTCNISETVQDRTEVRPTMTD